MNNKKIKAQFTQGSIQLLEDGWVGWKDGVMYFGPARGSGGFSLYSTEKLALKYTGLEKAIPVSLKLFLRCSPIV